MPSDDTIDVLRSENSPRVVEVSGRPNENPLLVFEIELRREAGFPSGGRFHYNGANE